MPASKPTVLDSVEATENESRVNIMSGHYPRHKAFRNGTPLAMKVFSFLLLSMLATTAVSAEGLLVERSYGFYVEYGAKFHMRTQKWTY